MRPNPRRPDRAHLPYPLLIGLLVGCSRGFIAPGAGGQLAELGTPCSDAAACASGFCTDGVCCSAACPATQVCDAPGFRGVCVDRVNGEACGAGTECPSGHCVDGVCCDAACQGLCMSCVVDGGAGHCQLAADDTDPRHDCGSCMACFSGVCGAAEPGTDPHLECDGGGWCGADQACHAGSLQACSVDADCAVGVCLAGRCARAAFSDLDGDPFLPTDMRRAPIAAAAGQGGTSALLVLTDASTDFNDDFGYLVALLAGSDTAPWTAVPLDYHAFANELGAATMVGHVAFFAVGHRGGSDPEPVSIELRGVTLDGDELGVESVTPDAGDLADLALGANPDGQLLVGYRGIDDHVHLGVRVSGEGWSLSDLGANSGGIAIASLASGAVALYTTDGGLYARTSDGQQSQPPPPFPVPCPGYATSSGKTNFLTASAVRRGDHDVASFTVWCDAPTNAYLLGTFDPGSAQRWSFQQAPAVLPGSSPEAQTPVDYLVSAGGRGGAPLFVAYMPASDAVGLQGPVGGYLSVAWAGVDAGFGSLQAYGPDLGFEYFGCTGAGAPDGLPFLACDTGVAGNVRNTNLRLQFMRFSE